MTIEWALLASVITLSIALYGAARNFKRDASDQTQQMTTVIVKLENIQQGIGDIKSDMSSLKEDVKAIEHRVTINEQGLKSRWKQIDALNGKGA